MVLKKKNNDHSGDWAQQHLGMRASIGWSVRLVFNCRSQRGIRSGPGQPNHHLSRHIFDPRLESVHLAAQMSSEWIQWCHRYRGKSNREYTPNWEGSPSKMGTNFEHLWILPWGIVEWLPQILQMFGRIAHGKEMETAQYYNTGSAYYCLEKKKRLRPALWWRTWHSEPRKINWALAETVRINVSEHRSCSRSSLEFSQGLWNQTHLQAFLCFSMQNLVRLLSQTPPAQQFCQCGGGPILTKWNWRHWSSTGSLGYPVTSGAGSTCHRKVSVIARIAWRFLPTWDHPFRDGTSGYSPSILKTSRAERLNCEKPGWTRESTDHIMRIIGCCKET